MPSFFGNNKSNNIENKDYEYLNKLGDCTKTSGTRGIFNKKNKYGDLEDLSYKLYGNTKKK